ncbi:hypothetical protein COCSUDRAFT_57253 [Coccomyxa subellipsoidea C-169]|uniref:Uncharacterized protein n=1 Tax=Coccomyxa subellipsoidea (strain C-169) TaxID=574566 RepID=I0YQL6_COCSC|nr:hypothetical protein COCSUDRAFT_57253 [Coccomyxa subellipsoidea C-169]EIE20685.1 hypothetical protein COCSUDRAFT_57253 [Coccomyxa subellipsoidea C-169]|eukprot:XP_005645229.1 hypothetical protein COCSUDRAFT_57253 [Coccomyxa subellipsoidea C-169]
MGTVTIENAQAHATSQPTVGRLSADRRPTLTIENAQAHATSQPTVGRPSADLPSYYQVWIYHLYETLMASQQQMSQHMRAAGTQVTFPQAAQDPAA